MSNTIIVHRGQSIKYLGDPKDLVVTPVEGDDTAFTVEYPDQPSVSMSYRVGDAEVKNTTDIEPPAITANYVHVGEMQPLPGYTLTTTTPGPMEGYPLFNGSDLAELRVSGSDRKATIGDANSTLSTLNADGSTTWTDNTGGFDYQPLRPDVTPPTLEYPYTWPWAPPLNQPQYTYSIPPADMTYEDLRLGEKITVSFDDVSSESYRVYHYPGGETVVINKPIALAITKGGHRLFDALGECHYIAQGWLQITWKVKPGEVHFVK